MKKKRLSLILPALMLSSLIAGAPALAESRYVTDDLEVTLRQGESTGHRIISMLKSGTQVEVLSTNKLDDSFSASPVIVDKELYLRGEKYLYCIAEK